MDCPGASASDGVASSPGIDIGANRRAQKWSTWELIGRAIWEALRGPTFRWVPRRMWGTRRTVLRIFGARIGRDVHICPTVRIAVPWNLDIQDEASVGDRAVLYSLGRITIGRGVTISQHAHLCAGTHDYLRSDMPLLKPPISIGDGAWVCADAFIGPGVNVGAYAIVGARAVVTKDVPENVVVAGNPARIVNVRPPVERHENIDFDSNVQ